MPYDRHGARQTTSSDRAGWPLIAPRPDLGGRLITPRAAAAAGVLFSVLLGTSNILLRTAVPAELGDTGDWLSSKRGRVDVALWLVPFAGIAFLWFIGVIRDRLGDREDRFFASVMFGSGLVYLAMTFTSAALAGALVGSYQVAPVQLFESGGYDFAREAIFSLTNTFGVRMSGVFMLSTGTIWWRSRSVPRWIAGLTYFLAILQVIGPDLSLWMTLVFPLWVLIVSIHFLVAPPAQQSPVPGDEQHESL